MVKSRFLKLTAVMLILALFVNTCITGMLAISAAEAQNVVTEANVRYSDKEGTTVLEVPNDSNADVKMKIRIPVSNLDSSYTYQLKDTVTGKVLINNFTTDNMGEEAFNATIKAGEVGVYAIEKVASVKSGTIEYDTAPSDSKPATYAELRININTDFSIDYTNTAKMLCENIYVNGISVEEGIKLSGADNVCIAGSSTNSISVFVNQNDNPFGITAGGSVNLQIKDGIMLDGYALEDCNLEWPYVGKDKNAVCYHSTNKIVDADYTNSVITLTAEDRLESFVGKEDAVALIGGRIKINNTAVSAEKISVDENQIKIAYSTYDDFDIYVANGIILNGREISPARYNVAVEGGSAASNIHEQGDYVEVADIEGAVRPYFSYLKYQTGFDCGDANHITGNAYVLNFVMENANTGDKNIQRSEAKSSYSHIHIKEKDTVNPYIIINGKSIEQWLKEPDANEWRSIHLCEASYNTFQIVIPENNIFGFDPTKPFTITFAEGLKLNDQKPVYVNARSFNCPGHDFSSNKQYDGAYFSKVTKWSSDMVSADKASATGFYLNTASADKVCPEHGDQWKKESWYIDIPLDKSVYNHDNITPSYYFNHLQAPPVPGGTRTDFSSDAEIREKILINGKNLNDLQKLANVDWTVFLHVQLMENNTLRIMIPKDNVYGFNGDGNFTIQVKDGIVMNGITLNPFVYTHIAGKPVTATFTKPTVTVSGSEYVIQDNYHKIRIRDDKTKPQLMFPDLNDTINFHLQNMHTMKSDVYKELAVDLCKYIKINGYNIAEGNLKANHYYSAMVSLNNDGRVLQLQIDMTNVYKISKTERCTVEVLEGLNINGYEIEPVVYYYDGNGKTVTSKNYFASVGTLENGEIIAHSADSLKAGDTFGVEVKAAEGYRLKPGTLTYNYWYRGEYVKQPITEYSSADGYYKAVSPDVNGVLMAEFVDYEIGDANNDKVVDIRDLIRVKRYLAGTTTDISIEAADFDGDGEVKAADLASLRKYLLGVKDF